MGKQEKKSTSNLSNHQWPTRWIIQIRISLQRSALYFLNYSILYFRAKIWPNWPHMFANNPLSETICSFIFFFSWNTSLHLVCCMVPLFSCFAVQLLCDFNRVHHISHFGLFLTFLVKEGGAKWEFNEIELPQRHRNTKSRNYVTESDVGQS